MEQQQQQHYKSDVERIRIDNFSLGYIQDSDDSTIGESNPLNSFSGCENVDVNVINGTVSKRPGFAYDTDRFGILPTIDNYHLHKVYEFIGADNNLIQILCYKHDLNWILFYRVGNTSYLPMKKNPSSSTDEIYAMSSEEEPTFDSYDGTCRIGLGKRNDPIILFYNRIEGFFSSEPYRNSTETSNPAKIDSLLTTAKGWYIRRQIPQISSDVINSIEIQNAVTQWPKYSIKLNVDRLFSSFNYMFSNHLGEAYGTILVFTNCYGTSPNIIYDANNSGRLPFGKIIFRIDNNDYSSSEETLIVGISQFDDQATTQNKLSYLKQQILSAWGTQTDELQFLTDNNNNKLKVKDAFDFNCSYEANSSGEYYLTITVEMKTKGTGGADHEDSTFSNVSKWYVPPIFFAMGSNEYGKIFEGLYYDNAENYGGWGASDSELLINKDYTISNPNIINPSVNMIKGEYEFKFTLTFNNEETIPISINIDNKKTITNINDKIGIRVKFNNTLLDDYRYKAINVYAKRTIPITEDMESEERNEAAKYTDLDFRLVKSINLIKSIQTLQDRLRENAEVTLLNNYPPYALPSYIGFYNDYSLIPTPNIFNVKRIGPCIWYRMITPITLEETYYLDWIYSDLISGSGMDQSTGQEDMTGYLAQRLDRENDDEGIISYNGSIYFRGRRYMWGCKKRVRIEGSTEERGAEYIPEYVEYNDRIYYTLITSNLNQLDITSNSAWLCVKESERIMVIKEWRNTLLVFTDKSMYRIDIGMNSENVNSVDEIAILDAFSGQGCDYPKTLISTDQNLIWANQYSIWAYSDKGCVDLLSNKWKNEFKQYPPNSRLDLLGEYCAYNNSYWLYLCNGDGGGGRFKSYIYILDITNNLWTIYTKKDKTIILYRGLDNILYLGYLGVDYVVRFQKFPKGYSLSTHTYHDTDHIGKNYYVSYFTTQKLLNDSSNDKQFQRCIFYYKGSLFISYKYHFRDAEPWLCEDIKLRPTTQYKQYESFGLPVPFGVDSGLMIKVSDTGLESLWILKVIDALFTVVDEVDTYHGF